MPGTRRHGGPFHGDWGVPRRHSGWFDWEAREIARSRQEQVEVLALTGDVASNASRPAVHAHAVVSGRDGNDRGGHLMRGRVGPTLELVVDEVPAHLAKRHDDASGLALIAR